MSPARSEPPDLPGYTYQRWLGGGGFADVFLYHQQRPAREVAVKVLRAAATDELQRGRFDAEADLMARVSTHPYITSIFAADIASDGRPFLVMEYYPNGHYGTLARGGGMAVAEVLRTGVQVASAVETAHRAGILHRDIKPANILVSTYRWPGLTDFGIAGARGDEAESSGGLSLPYSPPEVISGESSTVQSDVYSLATTVYLLLAGRTPFEVPGRNTDKELAGRILNGTPPHSGRSDAPASLEHLLAQALAKDPASRPPSAAAFAQALQDVERELQLSTTPFEVRIDDPVAAERRPDDEERTRAAAIQVARSAPPPPASTQHTGSVESATSTWLRPPNPPGSASPAPTPPTLAARLTAATPPAPVLRGSGGPVAPPVTAASADELGAPQRSVTAGPAVTPQPGTSGGHDAPIEPERGAANTVRRAPVVPAPPPVTPPADGRRRTILLASGAAVAVVVVGAVIAVVAIRGSGGDHPRRVANTQAAQYAPTTTVPPLVAAPGPPSDVKVAVQGTTARVTWNAPDAIPGDRYRVIRVDPGHASSSYLQVGSRSATIRDIGTDTTPCFEVLTVRSDQISGPSSPGCAAP